MSLVQRTVRGAAIIGLFAVGACQSGAGGGLGSILGSVLGGTQGQAQQIDATVRGVDTRSQQLTLQQTNGQNVAVLYDNNTQVVYQNRNYGVTSLENGDRITARLQPNQNGGYYVDLITVTQPVNGSGGTVNNGGVNNNNIQTLQGTVRQVDRNNGLFTVETSPNVVLTVSMPYNPARNDSDRFQNLRNGDFVRFYGTYLNASRVQLTQFY